MSKISREQVENIANLARLKITEEEKSRYQTELSSILDMVEKLNEINTDGIDPIDQITGLKNVLTEDKVEVSPISREELLKNAPDREAGFIKVKKVLE